MRRFMVARLRTFTAARNPLAFHSRKPSTTPNTSLRFSQTRRHKDDRRSSHNASAYHSHVQPKFADAYTDHRRDRQQRNSDPITTVRDAKLMPANTPSVKMIENQRQPRRIRHAVDEEIGCCEA